MIQPREFSSHQRLGSSPTVSQPTLAMQTTSTILDAPHHSTYFATTKYAFFFFYNLSYHKDPSTPPFGCLKNSVHTQIYTLPVPSLTHSHTNKRVWGSSGDWTNTAEQGYCAGARQRDREKGWGEVGVAFRLLQWFYQWVEIKCRKVLGQVEAWPRWWKTIWRTDQQKQVLHGGAVVQVRPFSGRIHF